MQPYYLGIDIGTTSAKAVAFSAGGDMLCAFSQPYKMLHPAPGQSELHPLEVYEGVVVSCNKVLQKLKGYTPQFVAFSAAMHSLIVVNEEGSALTNCIIWADNRAAVIAEELHLAGKAQWYYQHTGVPVHAMSPLCKLLWMQQHQPWLCVAPNKFIGIKEFVYYRFTGHWLVDSSVASSTGLLDAHTLQWNEEVLNSLGIEKNMLATVVPPTYTLPYSPALPNGPACHLPINTPVVIGASDGALSNLGCGLGAEAQNILVVNIGTSIAARLITNGVEMDNAMRTFCYHLNNDLYIIGGPGNNGAVVMEWLKEKLLEAPESYALLFKKAEAIQPGSGHLLFLPYILGERAPVWNSNARGVFFGLDISHTQSHLVRACMEGILFNVYSIVKIVVEKRHIEGIQATGGFAQSSLWLQMLADVTNYQVAVSGPTESSALGAVMLGIEALGLPLLPKKTFEPAFTPNPAANQVYMQCFEQFERLYSALNNLWPMPDRIQEAILV